MFVEARTGACAPASGLYAGAAVMRLRKLVSLPAPPENLDLLDCWLQTGCRQWLKVHIWSCLEVEFVPKSSASNNCFLHIGNPSSSDGFVTQRTTLSVSDSQGIW